MRVVTQVLWLPKYGNTDKEYEDAFCPKEADQEAEFFRCAVADGATETSFSREWAEFLVHQYCRGEFNKGKLWLTIPKYRKQWFKRASSKPLPWYAEEKLQMGAYSSLVGLTLSASKDDTGVAQWEALAIGDSCVFQIRNDQLKLKWPLESSDQFGYHPILVSTKPALKEELTEQRTGGEYAKGDIFYLMSDAIAQWYLKEVEQGGSPNEVVPNFVFGDSSPAFSNWISRLRGSGAMRNDDVTLLRVLLT